MNKYLTYISTRGIGLSRGFSTDRGVPGCGVGPSVVASRCRQHSRGFPTILAAAFMPSVSETCHKIWPHPQAGSGGQLSAINMCARGQCV